VCEHVCVYLGVYVTWRACVTGHTSRLLATTATLPLVRVCVCQNKPFVLKCDISGLTQAFRKQGFSDAGLIMRPNKGQLYIVFWWSRVCGILLIGCQLVCLPRAE